VSLYFPIIIDRIEKEPQKLIEGLKIVMEVTNAERGIVCLKGIHTEAIEILKMTIRFIPQSVSAILHACFGQMEPPIV
jgi:hypothetical protein